MTSWRTANFTGYSAGSEHPNESACGDCGRSDEHDDRCPAWLRTQAADERREANERTQAA